jgi:hypothetical protein
MLPIDCSMEAEALLELLDKNKTSITDVTVLSLNVRSKHCSYFIFYFFQPMGDPHADILTS